MSIGSKMLIDKTIVDFVSTDAKHHDDLWVDALGPLYDLSPVGVDQAPQPRLGHSWLLDQLVLSEAVFTDQVIQRGKHHLNGFAPMLWLGVLLRGEIRGSLNDEQVQIRPGEIQILDFGRKLHGQVRALPSAQRADRSRSDRL